MRFNIGTNDDIIQIGDVIITMDNTIRMIVKMKGNKYGALDMETGRVNYECDSISDLLAEYEIAQVIKNNNLTLSSAK